ncbi:MAG: pectin esterase [Calditrichaeota bacterium]|nr:pectin esterase [Calditrichota bacterium]
MRKTFIWGSLAGAMLLLSPLAVAAAHADLVVDQRGGGDARTIGEALEKLGAFSYPRIVILVRNGVYAEKIRISRNYITLRGESRDSTIIRYPQLRSEWDAVRDCTGPAVVNIHGDDVILDNLTIENSQPEIGPHAFAVYGQGTRTIITNCTLLSKGADTVSLWDYKTGMYYHANCRFEGAVDFVCPRGWCFIRDSRFYEVKTSAALWHAGGYHPDQKLVVRNSDFDGAPGFKLGRHHYDAQFYLLDCRFSENLADQPIYRKTYPEDTLRNNPAFFENRYYFHNSRKAGPPFSWLQDNLANAAGTPAAGEITAAWTFGGQWDPENEGPVAVVGVEIRGQRVILTFEEIVSVRGNPVFANAAGQTFRIFRERYLDINRLTFIGEGAFSAADLRGPLRLVSGDIIASKAYCTDRSIGANFAIPAL